MDAKVWNNKYGTIVQKKRGHNCTKWAHCAKREQMEHWEKYAQSANFRGVTWDLADMYSKHLPADQHTTSPETQVMEIVRLIRNILNSELWSQLCELWLFWYWWWWRYYVNRIKSSSNLATCKYLDLFSISRLLSWTNNTFVLSHQKNLSPVTSPINPFGFHIVIHKQS